MGTSYLNIILDDDFDPSANQIAKILADTNAQVSILDTKGSTGRNAVIVAGQRIDFAMPRLTVDSAVMRHKLKKELEKMRFYTWSSLIASL